MNVRVLTVVAVAVMLAGCAPVAPAPKRQVQNPCIRHAPLDYRPILVKVILTANYNLKDAQGFQQYTPAIGPGFPRTT